MPANPNGSKDFRRDNPGSALAALGALGSSGYSNSRIVTWITVIALLVFLFFIRSEIANVTTVVHTSLSGTPTDFHTRHYREGINDNETAFVFGGTGIYTTSEMFKCMAAVETLATIGGWGGNIYLLLDDDSCLDKKIFASLPNKNIHVVQIENERRRRLRSVDSEGRVGGHAISPHGELLVDSAHGVTYLNGTYTLGHHDNEIEHRKLLNKQPFQRSMQVKMHILDHLPEHIKYAAWYDCDVMFIKPNCVKAMIENKPDITKEKPIFLRKDNFVGSFVAKRGVSEDALNLWREELLKVNSASSLGSKDAVPDNIVFSNLFGYDHTKPTAKYGISHKSWHDQMPQAFPHNGSIYWNTTECAMHLSNGRCRHLGGDEIDRVVKGYNLQSYQGRKWCPSLIRRKMKNYGINWPFCWTPPSWIWDKN